MPLFLFYASSFERSLKNLDPQQRVIIASIIESLEIYYANSCDLSKVFKIENRFFYKKLRLAQRWFKLCSDFGGESCPN